MFAHFAVATGGPLGPRRKVASHTLDQCVCSTVLNSLIDVACITRGAPEVASAMRGLACGLTVKIQGLHLGEGGQRFLNLTFALALSPL